MNLIITTEDKFVYFKNNFQCLLGILNFVALREIFGFNASKVYFFENLQKKGMQKQAKENIDGWLVYLN